MIKRRHASILDVVSDVYVVGKVELHPFSLGHHFLFTKMALPFADAPEADCSLEQIMVGIAVCGLSYEENLLAVRGDDYPRIIANWKRKVGFSWWRCSKASMDSETKIRRDWTAYLNDGYRMPPVYRRQSINGIEMTAPWELLLKVRLTMAGFTEPEVFNGYLPAMWYYYFTAVEIKAAEACEDVKNWKKIFLSAKDAEAMDQLDEC